MPRLPRVYIEGSLYYVTCRGLAGQKIFHENEDYKMYFGLLKKYKDELEVKIYAYTLMSSHLHLLLEVNEHTSLSTLMHNLNTSYTKYYNSRYERQGHLFRERFRAAIIEKDPQTLLYLSAHIHLNAKRLGIALEAQSYPNSSYSLYLNYEQADDGALDIKNEIAQVLSGLVGENYAEYMKKMEKSGDFKKLHNQLQRKKVAGSDQFIEKVRKEINSFRPQDDEQLAEPQEQEKKTALSVSKATGLLIVVAALSGVYFYFNYTRPVPEKKEVVAVNPQPEQIKQITTAAPEVLIDLNQTQWQADLLNLDGTIAGADILTFEDGKFQSDYFSRFAYKKTKYSMIIRDNKIIWETIQISPNGSVSWHGEVEVGQMYGIVNLRQSGKITQEFSFKSVKYGRK
ncbi:MAG: transposase [Candidatus Omnitrophica bacterium]|nr:transposase [Candidatus Omnitrophota bacterium]